MQVHTDVLTISITAHSDYPVPDSVQSGTVLSFDVGGRVDRDALLAELQEALRGHPYVLDDHYSRFSWGASGGFYEIAVQVAELIGGVASVGWLVEKLNAIASKHGWDIPRRADELEPDELAEGARKAVARLLGVRENEVTAEDVHDTPWGHLVSCGTTFGRFQVEMRDDGIDHVSKLTESGT